VVSVKVEVRKAMKIRTHVEDGCANGTPDRIAAEGVEVEGLGEGPTNFWPGDDSTKRESIANALGHGDNVRLKMMAFKAPKVLTRSPKACLHFVRDKETSAFLNVLLYTLQVAAWILNRATDALLTHPLDLY
jgi:hypothetical protein